MKVVVKDENGKVLQKFWGNLICVHDLGEKFFRAILPSGGILHSVSKPKCVYENELYGTITVEAAE